ncbi:MAG TPA: hypothetical protein DIC31_00500 [Rhizobiales bacterium]|jgi:hypothetical protein|nr:hypothetical protein [Hyphomicrobiales bacterium]
MSVYASIFPDSHACLSGSAKRPALVDVPADKDCLADPVFILGGVRRGYASVSQWAALSFVGRSAIVISQKGANIGQGVAAFELLAAFSAFHVCIRAISPTRRGPGAL